MLQSRAVSYTQKLSSVTNSLRVLDLVPHCVALDGSLAAAQMSSILKGNSNCLRASASHLTPNTHTHTFRTLIRSIEEHKCEVAGYCATCTHTYDHVSNRSRSRVLYLFRVCVCVALFRVYLSLLRRCVIAVSIVVCVCACVVSEKGFQNAQMFFQSCVCFDVCLCARASLV